MQAEKRRSQPTPHVALRTETSHTWNLEFPTMRNYQSNLGFTTREATLSMIQHRYEGTCPGAAALLEWSMPCQTHVGNVHVLILWVSFGTILKTKMMPWMQSKNYLTWLNQNTYIWRMRSPTVMSFSLKESCISSACKYLSTSTRWAPKRIIWESPCGLIATTMHGG